MFSIQLVYSICLYLNLIPILSFHWLFFFHLIPFAIQTMIISSWVISLFSILFFAEPCFNASPRIAILIVSHNRFGSACLFISVVCIVFFIVSTNCWSLSRLRFNFQKPFPRWLMIGSKMMLIKEWSVLNPTEMLEFFYFFDMSKRDKKTCLIYKNKLFLVLVYAMYTFFLQGAVFSKYQQYPHLPSSF